MKYKLFSIRRIEISLAMALVVSVIVSLCSFGFCCEKVRDNVIRLHILANSDSVADQTVKLGVRDLVLQIGEGIFDGTVTTKNAEKCVAAHKEQIENSVNTYLCSQGFFYSSDVYYTEEYFETREYNGFTLPAGKYKAIKIILGNGQGHNWWCIMFPPLCLPAAECDITDNGIINDRDVVLLGGGRYAARFKIAEVIEKWRNKE